MASDRQPSPGRLTRLKTVLMGSVFAVALGGIVAGETVLFDGRSAQAQNLSAPTPQTQAQAAVPSFADVVERVTPAVVSIRVKTEETGSTQLGG